MKQLWDEPWSVDIYLKLSGGDACENINVLLSCSEHFPELFLPAPE